MVKIVYPTIKELFRQLDGIMTVTESCLLLSKYPHAAIIVMANRISQLMQKIVNHRFLSIAGVI